jgi:hypothetical protein
MVVAKPKGCVASAISRTRCTRLRPRHALACVDFDPVHPREFDHHAAIAHTESGSVMASAAHRQWQILMVGKIEHARDIWRTSAAHDQRRTPIECEVENQACRFVVGRLRCDYLPANLGNKFSNRRRIGWSGIRFACFEHSPLPGKPLKGASAKGRCRECRLLDELSSSPERHIRLHQLTAASLTYELCKRRPSLEFALVIRLDILRIEQ